MDKATTDKLTKVVTQIMARTDAEPFREPVDWKVRERGHARVEGPTHVIMSPS